MLSVYKDPDTFTWENYLSETGSTAAPPRAFKTRPPVQFKVGMKLEVVDRRVPFLIRVATISALKGHQVRVSFDGWPSELSYWLDDDSPDIHPVGWCLKTGHPLEPPLTAEEASVRGPCGVRGCRGLGSLRGGAHKQHAAATACPYARVAPPPDRLAARAARDDHHALPRERKVFGRVVKPLHSSTPNSSETPKEKLPRGRPPKHKRIKEVNKNDALSDEESLDSGSGSKRWRGSSEAGGREPEPDGPGAGAERGGGEEVAPPSRPSSPRPTAAAPRAPRTTISRHIADLELPHNPSDWSQNNVASLISRLAGSGAGLAAAEAQMTGAELVMASCEELAQGLRLRLGPAVKVYAAVCQLRAGLT